MTEPIESLTKCQLPFHLTPCLEKLVESSATSW